MPAGSRSPMLSHGLCIPPRPHSVGRPKTGRKWPPSDSRVLAQSFLDNSLSDTRQIKVIMLPSCLFHCSLCFEPLPFTLELACETLSSRCLPLPVQQTRHSCMLHNANAGTGDTSGSQTSKRDCQAAKDDQAGGQNHLRPDVSKVFTARSWPISSCTMEKELFRPAAWPGTLRHQPQRTTLQAHKALAIAMPMANTSWPKKSPKGTSTCTRPLVLGRAHLKASRRSDHV